MNARCCALLVVVVSATSCRREPPPVRPQTITQRPVADSPDVSVHDAKFEHPPSAERWRFPRIAQRGPRLEMDRSEGLEIVVGAGRLSLANPAFGECVEQLPEGESPENLPAVKDRSRAVWATLVGGGDEAALWLTTTAASLVVDDGCTRVADVTAALLGQVPGSEDPLFVPDGLVPEEAASNKEANWHDGAVVVGARPLFKVSGLDVTPTVEAWDVSDGTLARVTLLSEHEQEESITGREHVIWARVGVDQNYDVVVRSDVRFGADGPDQEDTRTDMKWTAPHGTAVVSVDAQRTTRADALNVGAGRCPEMEGAIIFEHIEEVVTWAFEDPNAKRVPLGRATRTATFASGCAAVASEELRGRKSRLFDDVPADPVKLQATDTNDE